MSEQRLIDANALKEDINVYFADSYHLIDTFAERIDAMPTIEPDTCEGCEWEFAFGCGECHRCSRHYEDRYERRTDETTI